MANKANLGRPEHIPLTLTGGATSEGNASYFYTDDFGVTYLNVRVTKAGGFTHSTPFATLPVGYRCSGYVGLGMASGDSTGNRIPVMFTCSYDTGAVSVLECGTPLNGHYYLAACVAFHAVE